jgi:carboxyl-terminal processing protease
MGYIIINIFWDNTYEEFKKALQELESKNIEGLILDLRDNGWGYLQSAVEILSLLVEDKEVLVKTKYRDSFLNKNYYSINDGKIFDKKIVVLVNGNSASASEITAWALKDYGKAIIVGEKTYWKWSVQEPFDVLNGGLLKITIAKWYTPQWISIEEAGITPDIEIKFQKEDYEKKYDRQLEEAKKILKSFEEKKLFQITIDEYKKENTSK